VEAGRALVWMVRLALHLSAAIIILVKKVFSMGRNGRYLLTKMNTLI
jgi:hypothetical protein